MDWQEFFHLKVFKETLSGTSPYFEHELRVPRDFSLEELLLEKFTALNLSEEEKKHFSLQIRKIYLRHNYFKCREFERILNNFIKKLSEDKDQILTLSTTAGGIYLFMGLLKHSPMILDEKRIICYSSELPLDTLEVPRFSSHIHFILRPHSQSFLRKFPSLWKDSHLIDLFQMGKA